MDTDDISGFPWQQLSTPFQWLLQPSLFDKVFCWCILPLSICSTTPPSPSSAASVRRMKLSCKSGIYFNTGLSDKKCFKVSNARCWHWNDTILSHHLYREIGTWCSLQICSQVEPLSWLRFIFMGKLERSLLYYPPVKPLSWLHFINDSEMKWVGDRVSQRLYHDCKLFNYPIKFNSLDTIATLLNAGNVSSISICTLCHPAIIYSHTFKNMATGFVTRIHRSSLNPTDFQKQRQILRNHLTKKDMMFAMYSSQLIRWYGRTGSPSSSTKENLNMTGFHLSLLTNPSLYSVKTSAHFA